MAASKPPKTKVAAKKVVAKKVAAKKPPAKAVKAVKAVKAIAIKVSTAPFTKSQCIQAISEQSDLTKSQVQKVMLAMNDLIQAHLKKNGPQSFTWPGLFKIMLSKKPATKAKMGTNPFTGEKMQFKAKPASRKIKVRALKGLKEMVL